jgi:large subunit ribosomal protein L15
VIVVKDKIKKFRGSRTCGGGTHKNRRGAGNRGGRGKAGMKGQHFYHAVRAGFGKRGFKHRMAKPKKIINLGELDKIAERLVAEEDGGVRVKTKDFGVDKILGEGNVTRRLIVIGNCSKRAKEKIESRGGTIVDRFPEGESADI